MILHVEHDYLKRNGTQSSTREKDYLLKILENLSEM